MTVAASASTAASTAITGGWRLSGPQPRNSAADRIVDDFREQILAGSIPRGTKLPTERELCAAYRVSAITVRAAMRSLATLNLIEVRHGTGSFVTAQTDALVGSALRSMIQIDRVTAPQILAVLGGLNAYAAELAAHSATDAQLAAMGEALDTVENGTSVDQITGALEQFLNVLAEASGNPLLASLCRLLSAVQVRLAAQLAAGDVARWISLTEGLRAQRLAMVRAIRDHDPAAARSTTLAYHASTSEMISRLPNAAETLDDPELSAVILGMMHQEETT
jgi:DNA-binding FadR family transcriptional regulator